jgi:hypothetical protein
VKRHYLHETAGTNRATCARIQGRVFRKKNADEKGRIDLLPLPLLDERIGNAEGKTTVMGVLIQNLTDTKRLLGGLRSVDDRYGQSEELARVRVQRMLLRYRPHGTADEQRTQGNSMGSCPHSGLHWRRQLRRWCV